MKKFGSIKINNTEFIIITSNNDKAQIFIVPNI